MSLFGKLTSLFRGAPEAAPESAPESSKNARNYERFHVRGDGHVTLRLATGAEGRVREASYCALGVDVAPGKTGFELEAGKVRGTLHVLGQSATVMLKPVRTSYAGGAPFTAFLLLHETPESLIFLRELLEPLRRGSSLLPIDAAVINDRFKGPEWACLRGDGPTDLVLRRNTEQDRLEEALLTYRSGESYLELAFENGRLLSRKSVDVSGVAARMGSSVVADPAAVRFAACMHFGLADDLRALLQPFHDQCLAALGLAVTEQLPRELKRAG